MERKGAHSVGGQLHCVQQGHLDEAVGLGATGWPVLIALHLQRDSRAGCLEVPKGSGGQKQGGRSSPQPRALRSIMPPLTKPYHGLTIRLHPCPHQGNEGRN